MCELVVGRPLLYLGCNPSRSELRRGGTWSPATKVVHSVVLMNNMTDKVRVFGSYGRGARSSQVLGARKNIPSVVCAPRTALV